MMVIVMVILLNKKFSEKNNGCYYNFNESLLNKSMFIFQ